MPRFNFDKQTSNFLAIVYNRGRAIWLSQNDTDCDEKCIFLKRNSVSLQTENIKTFVMKYSWIVYSKNLTNKERFFNENGLEK